MLKFFVNAFPLWLLIAGAIALIHPPVFTWFSGFLIPAGLAIVMLGMGVTLRWEDFRRVADSPYQVVVGVVLQYTIMPVLGWVIANFLNLSAPFAVGLILVASCPGGTASNVVSYLAKADVPLSVTMTSITTLMAAIMTPFLTSNLIGNRVEVSAAGLFVDTIQVVILPVGFGLLLHRVFPEIMEKMIAVSPPVAVGIIVLIVASIIGQGRDAILNSGADLILSVFLLHSAGFLFGYIFARLFRCHRIAARTISIEVGMQNSGLGVVLAKGNFVDPLTAIPSAISSLFHSLIGCILASIWRRRGVE